MPQSLRSAIRGAGGGASSFKLQGAQRQSSAIIRLIAQQCKLQLWHTSRARAKQSVAQSLLVSDAFIARDCFSTPLAISFTISRGMFGGLNRYSPPSTTNVSPVM